MKTAGWGRALVVCLALGAADVWALNELVLPEFEHEAAVIAHAPVLSAEPEPAKVKVGAIAAVTLPARAVPRATPVVVLEFAHAQRRVDHRALRALHEALEQLSDAPHITVLGHADKTGPAELNELLSAERAAAVARRLMEAGIERGRLHVSWRGAREPREQGENRRVEIYLGELP